MQSIAAPDLAVVLHIGLHAVRLEEIDREQEIVNITPECAERACSLMLLLHHSECSQPASQQTIIFPYMRALNSPSWPAIHISSSHSSQVSANGGKGSRRKQRP